MEEMNRLRQNANVMIEKYKEEDPTFLIAGRFTLKEMLSHRSFYRQEDNNEELFVPFEFGIDIDEYYHNEFDKNMTEFSAFLMMSDLELWRFLVDKQRCQK